MEWSAAHNRYIDPSDPSSLGRHTQTPRAWALRAAIFFGVFVVLQLGWEAFRGSEVERLVVHDGTVRPAAGLINWLTPDVHARAVDFSVRAQGGGLNILNGCEGLEALFLLLSAFLVAPIAWRSRLLGLAIGVPLVFVVNQVRILVLFYAYRADHSLFAPLHSTVTPIAVVLLVAAYFYLWLNHAAHPAAKSA